MDHNLIANYVTAYISSVYAYDYIGCVVCVCVHTSAYCSSFFPIGHQAD